MDLVYVVTYQISVRPLLAGQIAWLANRGWETGVICGRKYETTVTVGQAQF
jgi:hypothetical protein